MNTGPDTSPIPRTGGVAGIVLGGSIILYFVFFALSIAANPVKINGKPVDHPEQFADWFVQGHQGAYGTLSVVVYLLLAVVAVIGFTLVVALQRRLSVDSPALASVAAACGFAALILWVLTALASLGVVSKAGTSTLPRGELVHAIPILFGVVLPAFLGGFDLLAGCWVLLVSVAAFRTRTLPRPLVYFGFLSAAVLLLGTTGGPGYEGAIALWAIWTGIVLLMRPRVLDR